MLTLPCATYHVTQAAYAALTVYNNLRQHTTTPTLLGFSFSCLLF